MQAPRSPEQKAAVPPRVIRTTFYRAPFGFRLRPATTEDGLAVASPAGQQSEIPSGAGAVVTALKKSTIVQHGIRCK